MPMATDAIALSASACDRFAADGFALVPDLIDADEAERFRAAAVAYAGSAPARPGEVFRQLVNVWPHDAVLRGLTFHPRVLAAVQRLARRPMRLFHDQILIKDAMNGAASEFHQDNPYWPMSGDAFTSRSGSR